MYEDGCSACGNESIRTDVLITGGWVDGVPEGAEDLCILQVGNAAGFPFSINGIIIEWHDHEVSEEDVEKQVEKGEIIW